MNGGQSGMGLPHSKTLSRWIARECFREVLECVSPMPLSLFLRATAARSLEGTSNQRSLCKRGCSSFI
jgi:hypothetical protein